MSLNGYHSDIKGRSGVVLVHQLPTAGNPGHPHKNHRRHHSRQIRAGRSPPCRAVPGLGITLKELEINGRSKFSFRTRKTW